VVRAIVEPLAGSSSNSGAAVADQPQPAVVTVDNKADPRLTLIRVEAENRAGLLSALASTFRDLDLEVVKASVDSPSETRVSNDFYVKDGAGGKVTKPDSIMNVKRTLEVSLSVQECTMPCWTLKKSRGSRRPMLYRQRDGVTSGPGVSRRI
jgi:UTP:GlnB (protein PII) uridylyltransferase